MRVLILLLALVLSCDGAPAGSGEGEGEGQAGEGEGQAGEGEGEGQAGEGEGEGEGQAAGCVHDADCAGNQFCQGGVTCTCDTTNGQCVPQAPTCGSNADCTQAPFTFCDPATSQCALGTCQNGGVICNQGETCAADGRCLAGSATPCTADDACVAEEYCSVAFGQTEGACTTGCRTDADCPGQVCNGAHTCTDTAAAFGDACTDDSTCHVGLFCGVFSSTCQERCSGGPVDCTGGACCQESGLACCNQLGFCSAQGCQ